MCLCKLLTAVSLLTELQHQLEDGHQILYFQAISLNEWCAARVKCALELLSERPFLSLSSSPLQWRSVGTLKLLFSWFKLCWAGGKVSQRNLNSAVIVSQSSSLLTYGAWHQLLFLMWVGRTIGRGFCGCSVFLLLLRPTEQLYITSAMMQVGYMLFGLWKIPRG